MMSGITARDDGRGSLYHSGTKNICKPTLADTRFEKRHFQKKTPGFNFKFQIQIPVSEVGDLRINFAYQLYCQFRYREPRPFVDTFLAWDAQRKKKRFWGKF